MLLPKVHSVIYFLVICLFTAVASLARGDSVTDNVVSAKTKSAETEAAGKNKIKIGSAGTGNSKPVVTEIDSNKKGNSELGKTEVDSSDIDQIVQTVLRDWKVPGAAIAVVKDNDVVLCKGYGVTRYGSNESVDEQTIFAIGSCTKAFTSTAFGIMKDEGRLNWDDPVTRFIPSLALYDPYITNQINIRDLLAMRSGLESTDAFVSFSGFNSQAVIEHLRFVKPAAPFRYQFSYVNNMYLLAGEVLSRACGSSWEEFITSRILAPLHMSRTVTGVKQLAGLSNVASPHHMEKFSEVPEPIPYFDVEAMAPAGGLNSCALDLVNWLKLQMGKGQFNGKQLISQSALDETHAPQTIILHGGLVDGYPEADLRHMCYCMGWRSQIYRKHREIMHIGGIDGMTASVTILPDDGLGLAVLTNSDYANGRPQEIISDSIVDRFLRLPAVDWNLKLRNLELMDAASRKKNEARISSERVSGATPSHALKDYAGIFESDLYGQLKIECLNDQLVFSWPRLSARAEHWHFDTFKLISGNKIPITSFATFNQVVDGTVGSVDIPELGRFARR